jgi:hypothetical protein
MIVLPAFECLDRDFDSAFGASPAFQAIPITIIIRAHHRSLGVPTLYRIGKKGV